MGGLDNQIIRYAPVRPATVIDLAGLGVTAPWHDDDDRIGARKLPSFPVPAAWMARVGWRTPAGSYALPVGGLGVFGAAESALQIPAGYNGAVQRSKGDLPKPSVGQSAYGRVPANVAAIKTVGEAIQYARGSFHSAKAMNPAWAEFYRWPNDLGVHLFARFKASPGTSKADFDHAVGTLKVYIGNAEASLRAARAGTPAPKPAPPPKPPAQPTSPVVPAQPDPVPDPVPSPVAKAGLFDALFANPLLLVGGGAALIGIAWFSMRKK